MTNLVSTIGKSIEKKTGLKYVTDNNSRTTPDENSFFIALTGGGQISRKSVSYTFDIVLILKPLRNSIEEFERIDEYVKKVLEAIQVSHSQFAISYEYNSLTLDGAGSEVKITLQYLFEVIR